MAKLSSRRRRPLPLMVAELMMASWETIARRSLMMAKGTCSPAEYRHLAILHRAHDDKIGHDIEVIRPLHRIPDNLDRRDQVPVVLRLIDVGFPQGADPILQHIARGRVDQPEQ